MSAALFRKLIPEQCRPIGYLTHLTRNRTASTVQQGPFQGMRLVTKSAGSAYIPKLLGIYERELRDAVESLIAWKPDQVVDLGAAEGYYAVGMARRLPQAKIHAFEMMPDAQALLARNAKANDVRDQIEIHGEATAANLQPLLSHFGRTCVICDVEGAERQLLDPGVIPALKKTPVLVELHDFIDPEITALLKQRFQETHHIKHIWQTGRSRTEFPWNTLYTRLLPKTYLDWSVSEWRPVRMAWFWMTPRVNRI